MSASLRVLIYGGRGALGSHCVTHFKSAGYWVCSVDMHQNDEADANVLVIPSESLVEQEHQVVEAATAAVGECQLDAIFCVAGGWAGGSAKSKDFAKNCDLVLKQSVWTSVIASSLAVKLLKPEGLLTLTGAQAALGPTGGMIGYGFAKAGVHHLTRSLSDDKSGLPTGTTVLAILPVTLDTLMNRKWMPEADTSTWTPLSFVAILFDKWLTVKDQRPKTGSLVTLVTIGGETEAKAV